MPILASRGGASLKGFGFGGGAGFVWTEKHVLTVGDYKTHVFTVAQELLTVNKGGKVDYFVISWWRIFCITLAGGGGAGGFRMSNYEGLGYGSALCSHNLSSRTCSFYRSWTFHHQLSIFGGGGDFTTLTWCWWQWKPGGGIFNYNFSRRWLGF